MERGITSRLAVIFCLFMLSCVAYAQDDFGIWMSVAGEKKVNKRWSIEAEAELRRFDNATEFERTSLAVDAKYKFSKHLNAAAGYSVLYENNIKKKFYTDEDDNPTEQIKWIRQYWGVRHRAFAQVQGDIDLGRWNISLRERWQHTYRPGSTQMRQRYNRAGEWTGEEEDEISSKTTDVLRSRIKVEYNIRHCSVDPYASIEFTNDWKLEKTRVCLGADFKMNKNNTLGITYMYQNVHAGDDDNEPNSHIVSISYKCKF